MGFLSFLGGSDKGGKEKETKTDAAASEPLNAEDFPGAINTTGVVDGETTPSGISADAALEQIRNESDLLKDGRYRIASPETIETLRATQGAAGGPPAPRNQGMYGKEVGIPGLPADRRKMAIQKIKDQEGLEIGVHEKRKLAQQWRFLLSCEPIQRGFDAGIVLGSITAVGGAYYPKNRHALTLSCFWAAGFSAGMMLVPSLLLISEGMNQRRIKAKENEMFSKQRAAFISQQTKQE